MKHLPFNEAKVIVHKLKLRNISDWRLYCTGKLSIKIPDNIPKTPNFIYKNSGWTSWADWLGSDIIIQSKRINNKWMDFKKAKAFVHSLKLISKFEWYQYCKSGKKPDDIPADPVNVYKNKGWINWADWLGKD